MKTCKLFIVCCVVLLMTSCATQPPAVDYTAFRNADPASIIVLPPINNTTEVIAPYSVMAQIAQPIAESGFYVFPVAVVKQTFQNNGLTVAEDIHAAPMEKIKDIFGADAALYITIQKYGTSYVVLSSQTVVTVSASLVDLGTGTVLWQNTATASSAENQGSSGGGLVGALVQAAVTQIVETVTDKGFDIAEISNSRLLFSDNYNGLLYGPRSPKYGQPATSEKGK